MSDTSANGGRGNGRGVSPEITGTKESISDPFATGPKVPEKEKLGPGTKFSLEPVETPAQRVARGAIPSLVSPGEYEAWSAQRLAEQRARQTTFVGPPAPKGTAPDPRQIGFVGETGLLDPQFGQVSPEALEQAREVGQEQADRGRLAGFADTLRDIGTYLGFRQETGLPVDVEEGTIGGGLLSRGTPIQQFARFDEPVRMAAVPGLRQGTLQVDRETGDIEVSPLGIAGSVLGLGRSLFGAAQALPAARQAAPFIGRTSAAAIPFVPLGVALGQTYRSVRELQRISEEQETLRGLGALPARTPGPPTSPTGIRGGGERQVQGRIGVPGLPVTIPTPTQTTPTIPTPVIQDARERRRQTQGFLSTVRTGFFGAPTQIRNVR